MGTYRNIRLEENNYYELDYTYSLGNSFKEDVLTNMKEVKQSIAELFPTYSEKLQKEIQLKMDLYEVKVVVIKELQEMLQNGQLKYKESEINEDYIKIHASSYKAALKKILKTCENVNDSAKLFTVKSFFEAKHTDFTKLDMTSYLKKLEQEHVYEIASTIKVAQFKHRQVHDVYTIQAKEIKKFTRSTGFWLNTDIMNNYKIEDELMDEVYQAYLDIKEKYNKLNQEVLDYCQKFDADSKVLSK